MVARERTKKAPFVETVPLPQLRASPHGDRGTPYKITVQGDSNLNHFLKCTLVAYELEPPCTEIKTYFEFYKHTKKTDNAGHKWFIRETTVFSYAENANNTN